MSGKFFGKLHEISISQKNVNGYAVFDVQQDLGLGAEFSELTKKIEEALSKGQKKIALRFTADSYLYTPTLARLVNYYKIISEQGGVLCLIKPNENVLEVLDIMGLTSVVEMASSEEQVGI
jgi:anti-anti-sigma factor